MSEFSHIIVDGIISIVGLVVVVLVIVFVLTCR